MSKRSLDGINLKIDVQILKQGKFFIAYSPALELSSYGSSEEDAKHAFEEAVAIFLEDTIEKGTLFTILNDLGWKIIQKSPAHYEPPKVSSKKQKISPIYSMTSIDIRVPVC